MNRFPLWKNILVFVVVFVSAVLALPNLFGEDEAVQVSRADGVAMDAGALAQTTDALQAANVPYKTAMIEKNAAVILPSTPPPVSTSLPATSVSIIARCSFCFFCCGRIIRK